MGANSAIEWTHHTFNPWIGCTKISPECARCYAHDETFVRVQRGRGRELWGPTADRHITAPGNWRQPYAWRAAAAAAGERHRVFCASLADVAEVRPDLVGARARLCALILETADALDWLLLTKRLDDLVRLFPARVLERAWVGTTAGTRKRMQEEAPKLAGIPARVRFISAEPLLEDVAGDLRTVLAMPGPPIGWVIADGESSKPGQPPGRPMHPDWARGIRNVCVDAGVPFLFKQWGDWQEGSRLPDFSGEIVLNNGRHAKFAEDFSREDRSYWSARAATMMARVGKKKAGRELDGRTWDDLPEVRACV